MHRCLAIVCTALLLPALCLAQTPDGVAPAASAGHASSAAGAPLNDGELAPGILTVRVVRGGFAGNLPDRDVVLDVLGGPTRKARTNTEGRAEFSGVPVGAHVRASVVVDGDRLESAVFPMPIDSGVRVLLATPQNGADAVAFPESAPETSPVVRMTTALLSGETLAPNSGSNGPREPTTVESGTLMTWVLAVMAVVFAAAVLLRRSRSSHQS